MPGIEIAEADAELAARRFAALLQDRQRVGLDRLYLAGGAVELAAQCGRDQTGAVAFEQRHIECGLQLADQLSDRRLRHADVARGRGEAAGLEHRVHCAHPRRCQRHAGNAPPSPALRSTPRASQGNLARTIREAVDRYVTVRGRP